MCFEEFYVVLLRDETTAVLWYRNFLIKYGDYFIYYSYLISTYMVKPTNLLTGNLFIHSYCGGINSTIGRVLSVFSSLFFLSGIDSSMDYPVDGFCLFTLH